MGLMGITYSEFTIAMLLIYAVIGLGITLESIKWNLRNNRRDHERDRHE